MRRNPPTRLLALLVGAVCAGAAPASAFELSGTVRSSSGGAALMGARLLIASAVPRRGVGAPCPWCRPACGRWREADRQGRFAFGDFDSSLVFRLLVTSTGFEPQILEFQGPAAVTLDVRLAPLPGPEHAIRGRVLDRFGVPVMGAEVRPRDGGRSAISDESGRFLLPSAGPLDLWIGAPDLAPRILRGARPGEALEIRLLPGTDVRGQVLRDGRPLPQAVVALAQPFAADEVVATDESGRFTFMSAGAGDTLRVFGPVAAFGPDRALPATRFLGRPDDSITVLPALELQPAWTLRGRLLAANGRSAPPGARVRIERAEVGEILDLRCGRDGRFEATGLPRGEALKVSVPGARISPATPGYEAASGAVRADAAATGDSLVLRLEAAPEREPREPGMPGISSERLVLRQHGHEPPEGFAAGGPGARSGASR